MQPETGKPNESSATAAPRKRRRRKRALDTRTAINQLPGHQITNPFPALQPLSEDQLEKIHDSSMQLLEEQGIEVMGDMALQLFRAAGADVSGSGLVKMDRHLVMETIAKAPSAFKLHARNSQKTIHVGGNVINFGMVSGPPNVHDCISGRRAGNIADYKKLIKLGQYFNIIGFFGNQALAPTDLPANTRHLDTTYYNLLLSDKPFLATGIGAGRARDAVELCAIAKGKTLGE